MAWALTLVAADRYDVAIKALIVIQTIVLAYLAYATSARAQRRRDRSR